MSQRHPQRVDRGLADTRRSMGDGTARGRCRLATPVRRWVAGKLVVDPTDPLTPVTPCCCCDDYT